MELKGFRESDEFSTTMHTIKTQHMPVQEFEELQVLQIISTCDHKVHRRNWESNKPSKMDWQGSIDVWRNT